MTLRLHLRRLERPESGRDNPFAVHRSGGPMRRLVVGIHPSVFAPGAVSDILLGAFETAVRHGAVEIVRMVGSAPAWAASVGRAFEIRTRGDASAAHVAGPDGYEEAQVGFGNVWNYVASVTDFTVAELQALEGFPNLGCDVVIVADERLVLHRDERHLRSLRLVTPEEAAVAIGVASREMHRAFTSHNVGVNVGLYHWAVARALTPFAWPAFCAFNRAARQIEDGEEIADLAQSVLIGLRSTSRMLDRMYATWQCPVNNDTGDELLDDLGNVVRQCWTVYDNLALLTGRYLAIDLNQKSKNSPAWTPLNPRWTESMERRAESDSRAASILAAISDRRAYLDASHDIRNAMTHRARRNAVHLDHGGDDMSVVEVTGAALKALDESLEAIGDAPREWGLLERRPAGVVEVTDIGAEDTHEEQMEAAAYVDPMPFAIRLASHAAWLANEVFRNLNPRSDARVDGAGDCSTTPPEGHWSGTFGANVVLATSPIGGAVDWAAVPGAG